MSAQEKTLIKQKLFSKSGGSGMQAEEFNIEDFASTNVANALYKVFVEGVEKEQEPIHLTYMEKLETAEHRKYKVRVTGKDGRSYVRYADRQKISELRANPNIESVEMTGYGEPYEGEKKRGEQTAKAKAGKGLDPVGKEDKDIDNDGDHDKTDKYLLNRRKVRGAEIGKRKGVSEEFIGEVKSEKDDSDRKIDVLPKSKPNKVTLNPEAPGSSNGGRGMQLAHYDMGNSAVSESQAKFFTMLQEKAVSQNQQQLAAMAIEYLDGNMPDASDAVKQMAKMGRKELKKFARTSHKGLPEKVKEEMECGSDKKGEERDKRGDYAKNNLVKNKLRAMGMKNFVVMTAGYEPEGELVDEDRGGEFRSLGRADKNDGRNRYMGSATPEQEAEEKRRGDEAAERAKARLRRSLARERNRRR